MHLSKKKKIYKFVIIFSVYVLLLSGCEKTVSVLKTDEDFPDITIGEQSEEGKDHVSEKLVLQEEKTIFVDVSGAVVSPGVYQLPCDARVFQALEAAGGCTKEAQISMLNQAQILSDGQKIYVYTKQEAIQSENLTMEGTGNKVGVSWDGKININQASKEDLMILPGVGETRAEAIISYREKNGLFTSIEELMNVEGIKEKTYEKLKDKITAN